MEMPGRNYNSPEYRYGFNGKEKDERGELGELTHYDYGFRIYNPGIGRFLSVDPLTKDYPSWSPYPFAMNRPIDGIDLDGLEWRESTQAESENFTANGNGDINEGDVGFVHLSEDENHYTWVGEDQYRTQSGQYINSDQVRGRRIGGAELATFDRKATFVAETNSRLRQSGRYELLTDEGTVEDAYIRSVSLSFTGDAETRRGNDRAGRGRYLIDGDLTAYFTYDNDRYDIASYSANSGPWGYGPIPNGDYDVTSYRRTTERGMVAHGIGFKFYMTDNATYNRDGLRIHPDQVPSEGTAGCIGLTCNGAQLTEARNNIRMYLRWRNQIPLNVNATDNPNRNRPANSNNSRTGE